MNWSPENKNRCDSKLCQYATICNLITLFLILVFITGLAQANMSLDRMVVDCRPDHTHKNKGGVTAKSWNSYLCPEGGCKELQHRNRSKTSAQ